MKTTVRIVQVCNCNCNSALCFSYSYLPLLPYVHAGPPEVVPNFILRGTRHRSVLLAWSEPWSTELAGVESYAVELFTADGTTAFKTATVEAGSADREHTFNNLIHSTTYRARVAALNSVGRGDWTPFLEVTTPLPDRMCLLAFTLCVCIRTLKVHDLSDCCYRVKQHDR